MGIRPEHWKQYHITIVEGRDGLWQLLHGRIIAIDAFSIILAGETAHESRGLACLLDKLRLLMSPFIGAFPVLCVDADESCAEKNAERLRRLPSASTVNVTASGAIPRGGRFLSTLRAVRQLGAALCVPVLSPPRACHHLSEGEASCAALCLRGVADVVLSSDGDSFLFGAPVVLRSLSGSLSFSSAKPLRAEVATMMPPSPYSAVFISVSSSSASPATQAAAAAVAELMDRPLLPPNDSPSPTTPMCRCSSIALGVLLGSDMNVNGLRKTGCGLVGAMALIRRATAHLAAGPLRPRGSSSCAAVCQGLPCGVDSSVLYFPESLQCLIEALRKGAFVGEHQQLGAVDQAVGGHSARNGASPAHCSICTCIGTKASHSKVGGCVAAARNAAATAHDAERIQFLANVSGPKDLHSTCPCLSCSEPPPMCKSSSTRSNNGVGAALAKFSSDTLALKQLEDAVAVFCGTSRLTNDELLLLSSLWGELKHAALPCHCRPAAPSLRCRAILERCPVAALLPLSENRRIFLPPCPSNITFMPCGNPERFLKLLQFLQEPHGCYRPICSSTSAAIDRAMPIWLGCERTFNALEVSFRRMGIKLGKPVAQLDAKAPIGEFYMALKNKPVGAFFRAMFSADEEVLEQRITSAEQSSVAPLDNSSSRTANTVEQGPSVPSAAIVAGQAVRIDVPQFWLKLLPASCELRRSASSGDVRTSISNEVPATPIRSGIMPSCVLSPDPACASAVSSPVVDRSATSRKNRSRYNVVEDPKKDRLPLTTEEENELALILEEAKPMQKGKSSYNESINDSTDDRPQNGKPSANESSKSAEENSEGPKHDEANIQVVGPSPQRSRRARSYEEQAALLKSRNSLLHSTVSSLSAAAKSICPSINHLHAAASNASNGSTASTDIAPTAGFPPSPIRSQASGRNVKDAICVDSDTEVETSPLSTLRTGDKVSSKPLAESHLANVSSSDETAKQCTSQSPSKCDSPQIIVFRKRSQRKHA